MTSLRIINNCQHCGIHGRAKDASCLPHEIRSKTLEHQGAQQIIHFHFPLPGSHFGDRSCGADPEALVRLRKGKSSRGSVLIDGRCFSLLRELITAIMAKFNVKTFKNRIPTIHKYYKLFKLFLESSEYWSSISETQTRFIITKAKFFFCLSLLRTTGCGFS